MNPNVILITADSLRVGGVRWDKANGQSLSSLRQFASQGIAFPQAIAQGPYTTASIPSLLTGKYPSRLKPIASDKIAGVLMEGAFTLAELLHQAGYHTAAFHSNPLLSRIFGYNQGFDDFYDDLFLQSLKLSRRAMLLLNRLQRILRRQPYLPAEGLNWKALAWLKKAREPFFLWLHYMEPHGPYQSRNGFQYLNKLKAEQLWRKAVKHPEAMTLPEVEELKRGYREEVAHLDRQLGILLEELQQMGPMESSLIIFTSDHGDAFGEHGLFSHPHQLYEELIRVPLIFRIPGLKPKTVEKPVPLVSLVPTILDFAGVKTDESFDGCSLRPLLESDDESCLPEYIISEAEFTPYYIGAIRTDEWKFILNERAGTKELYHLVEDQEEQRNVIHEYPQVAEELEAKLRAHLSAGKPEEGEPDSAELSWEETKVLEERLRSLGYL
jgi:arylsulfatase